MQVLNITEDDRLLVIAPHPDDECIGAGGVLALYPHICKVIVLTDGRQGQSEAAPEKVKQIRRTEFENEMQSAGIRDYDLLNYEDGSLMQHTDCLENIDLSFFSKIFVTGIHDHHPDHTAACISVYKALEKQEIVDVEIYLYEVHSPLQEVSHMLDITEVMDKKVSLIRCHQSQLGGTAYDRMAKCLAKFRALQNRMKDSYIETYAYLSPQNYLDHNTVELENRLQKSILFYWVLTQWMDIKIQGYHVADILEKMGYKSIAVYGYAEMGKLLCKDLLSTNIQVDYILDKRVKNSGIENLPIFVPKKGLPEVDAVVVTAVYYFGEIKEELLKIGYSTVISFRNLLEVKV